MAAIFVLFEACINCFDSCRQVGKNEFIKMAEYSLLITVCCPYLLLGKKILDDLQWVKTTVQLSFLGPFQMQNYKSSV